MLDRWGTYLRFGNTFCGIEHSSREQESLIRAVTVKQDKQGINLHETYGCTSIEELSSQLPKKQHAWLCINDEKALTKKVIPKQSDTLKAMNKAFPGVRVEDFYYEIYAGKDHQLICLVRMEHVDKLISTYQAKGVRIIGVSLGGLCLGNIEESLGSTTVFSRVHSYTFEDGTLTSIDGSNRESSSHQLTAELTLEGDFILPFASTINYFRGVSNQHNLQEKLQELGRSDNERQFFKQFSRIGMVFLLFLFLLNFLLFSNYNEQVQTLAQEVQVNNGNKQRLLELNAEVERKQKMVSDMQSSNASKSSYYMDQVAKVVPATMSLSLLEYQPLSQRIREDEPIELEQGILRIHGSHKNAEHYHEWFRVLEGLPIVDRIAILSYGSDDRSTVDFQLKIFLVDE